MITVISPAKSMDFDSPIKIKLSCSVSKNLQKTALLLNELQNMSFDELRNIIETSDKLTQINYSRYQSFEDLPEKPAIYAYDGDVYRNIGRGTIDNQQMNFAQNHVGIISGFYGLLRPLDQIKPYRLEMKAKTPINAPKGLNIFWRDAVTKDLNDRLSSQKGKCVVNLASEEYSKAIDRPKLNAQIIDIYFLENRSGVLKNIAINAKRARGMMLGYIIQHGINDPLLLRKFDLNGYSFNEKKSTDISYYFVKNSV
ncbi:MAG: hypothetical protein DGJ47_000921 [Rickettsiaceae bacterium]